MKKFLLNCVLLCIVLNSANAASYYYRAGREIIVPIASDPVPAPSELNSEKQVSPVVVDEVAPVVKEAIVADVQLKSIESPAESVVSNQVQDDNSKVAENSIKNLDNLEIQKQDASDSKATTIKEAVKAAALEAIRSVNAETVESIAESAEFVVKEGTLAAAAVLESKPTEKQPESVTDIKQPVEQAAEQKSVPVVTQQDVPATVVDPAQPIPIEPIAEVKPIVPEVKSIVPEVKSVPLVEPVVEIKSEAIPEVKETSESKPEAPAPKEETKTELEAEKKPTKPEEEQLTKSLNYLESQNQDASDSKVTPQLKEAEPEQPAKEILAKEEPPASEPSAKPEEEKSKPTEPESKESPKEAGSLRQQPTLVQQAQETFNNLLTNNPFANAINNIRNPSSTEATGIVAAVSNLPAAANNAISNAISSDPTPNAAPTTARPTGPAALLQTIQNTLSNIGSNINNVLRPDQRTSTVAPAAVQAAVASEEVPIIQQKPETVSNKIDDLKSVAKPSSS